MTHPGAGAALILLLAGLVRAQGPPSREPTQDQRKGETFSASASLVLVDFVVTDKDDRAVRGLTAKDFVVKEDGKERSIISFAAFGSDAPRAADGPAAGASPAMPRLPASAALTATVILVDDGHLSAEQAIRIRPALKALISIVATREGGLAMIAPWSEVSVAAALPAGAAGLLAGVDQIVGHRVFGRDEYITDSEAVAVERGDRAAQRRVSDRRQSIRGRDLAAETGAAQVRGESAEAAHEARRRREDLYGFVFGGLEWLSTKSGRRSLIMVSDGFASDPNDVTRLGVITRSLQVNAPIHFVDPRALPGISRFQGVEQGAILEISAGEGPFAWSQASEGATALSVDTGGVVVQGTSDMAKGLTRVLESMKTYYVIGYEPGPSKNAGYRKIKVETGIKDVKILARRGYLAGEPTSK